MTKNEYAYILSFSEKERKMKKDESLDLYFYITGWICICLLAIFALVIHIFGRQILELVPPCAFHKITGFYCPGCGGTRAVFSLARGEIVRSFIFHPIVIYTLIVGGWFLISQSIQRITRNKIRIAMHFRPIYIWLALIIVLGNFFIKNALLLFCNIALLG